MTARYDVIVVGAGHAGCEAAAAAAKLGSKVLLITMDMGKMAQMSCNPAVGGIAKGQIVREIDALGGCMGLVTDAATIQFRMLNRSKGPAMWSPRAQCDKVKFSITWRNILENTCNLDIWQDFVTELIVRESHICGVRVSMGAEFESQTVILTAGTFLNGRLFIGRRTAEGGRIGELPSKGLTEQLVSFGCEAGRMKTGTPPRIDIRSIDTSALEVQEGDIEPEKFSYLPCSSAIQSSGKQKVCYIAHTNSDVHSILEGGFKDSPLFTGAITGIGPRYCPSIEDKLKTFAGKDSHQLFLEPEGWDTNEYYLQGFSSSLPLDIQLTALRKIRGFDNAVVFRPAYAVEYDFFNPMQLSASLESRIIRGLFMAGQINGTTGYEEAAAQGLIAGINAHNKCRGKEPFILRRDEAYIGVLIDDLVTKGVDEPYRMFTSRAEYRILLRQDNADARLTEKSHSIGLASDYRLRFTQRKYAAVDACVEYADKCTLSAGDINGYLEQTGSSPLTGTRKFSEILLRPNTSFSDILKNVPRGTFEKEIASVRDELMSSVESGEGGFLCGLWGEVIAAAETAIKYKGYIERESRAAEKIARLENLKIPEGFDFKKISALSMECRMKLDRYKPATIAQASRISGVSPADISVLLVYFGR